MIKSASHWLPDDAKPFHDPESPELEQLIKRMEKANARRQREAKKRQKAA